MSISPADYASASALVRGVVTRLRSAAVFDDQPAEAIGKYFGVQPGQGRPPRNFGQWYASVRWGGARQADSDPQSHDVYHGIVVTLTARLSYAPKDRQGIRLASAGDLYDLAAVIAGPNVVHGNYDVLAAANALIPGTTEYVALHGGSATTNGFIEPLVAADFGPEREEGPDWIGADTATDVYVIDVRFKDARHLKPYGG